MDRLLGLPRSIVYLAESLAHDAGHFLGEVAELERAALVAMPRLKVRSWRITPTVALGAEFDNVEQFAVAGIGELGPQHWPDHEERGQDIVHIVGDTAREGADGLDALGVEKLILQFFALGDVFRGADDAHDRAGGIPDGVGVIAHPADAAVGADDAVGLVVGAGRLLFAGGEPDALPVFGMDAVEPGERCGVGFGTGTAPDFFVARALGRASGSWVRR